MEDYKKIQSLSTAMKGMERLSRNPKPHGFEKNEIKINPLVFQRLDEMAVKQKWKEIVGPMLANSVKSMNLVNKVLYVNVYSATVRNELVMSKSVIVGRINKELKQFLVKDIVVK